MRPMTQLMAHAIADSHRKSRGFCTGNLKNDAEILTGDSSLFISSTELGWMTAPLKAVCVAVPSVDEISLVFRQRAQRVRLGVVRRDSTGALS